MKTADKPSTKRKRHEQRELARILFVTSDMTAEQIAVRLDITPKTIGIWRKEDNWDTERTLRNVSPIALIKRFNEEIERILAGSVETGTGGRKKLTPADADMISKLSKSIKDLRNSVDPQTRMEVLNDFMADLSAIDINLAQLLADPALSYIKRKLKESKER